MYRLILYIVSPFILFITFENIQHSCRNRREEKWLDKILTICVEFVCHNFTWDGIHCILHNDCWISQ